MTAEPGFHGYDAPGFSYDTRAHSWAGGRAFELREQNP